MAGNSSTGSSFWSLRSWGILLANFHTHLSTNSATLASFDSAEVPFEGKGLTICKSRAKRVLKNEDETVISIKVPRNLPEY